MFEYIHDEEARAVYRLSTPAVVEIRQSGKRWGWRLTTEILISRVDNCQRNGTWEHKTSDNPSQDFPILQYSDQEVMLNYFLIRHTPKGAKISEIEYLELAAKYNAVALAN